MTTITTNNNHNSHNSHSNHSNSNYPLPPQSTLATVTQSPTTTTATNLTTTTTTATISNSHSHSNINSNSNGRGAMVVTTDSDSSADTPPVTNIPMSTSSTNATTSTASPIISSSSPSSLSATGKVSATANSTLPRVTKPSRATAVRLSSVANTVSSKMATPRSASAMDTSMVGVGANGGDHRETAATAMTHAPTPPAEGMVVPSHAILTPMTSGWSGLHTFQHPSLHSLEYHHVLPTPQQPYLQHHTYLSDDVSNAAHSSAAVSTDVGDMVAETTNMPVVGYFAVPQHHPYITQGTATDIIKGYPQQQQQLHQYSQQRLLPMYNKGMPAPGMKNNSQTGAYAFSSAAVPHDPSAKAYAAGKSSDEGVRGGGESHYTYMSYASPSFDPDLTHSPAMVPSYPFSHPYYHAPFQPSSLPSGPQDGENVEAGAYVEEDTTSISALTNGLRVSHTHPQSSWHTGGGHFGSEPFDPVYSAANFAPSSSDFIDSSPAWLPPSSTRNHGVYEQSPSHSADVSSSAPSTYRPEQESQPSSGLVTQAHHPWMSRKIQSIPSFVPIAKATAKTSAGSVYAPPGTTLLSSGQYQYSDECAPHVIFGQGIPPNLMGGAGSGMHASRSSELLSLHPDAPANPLDAGQDDAFMPTAPPAVRLSDRLSKIHLDMAADGPMSQSVDALFTASRRSLDDMDGSMEHLPRDQPWKNNSWSHTLSSVPQSAVGNDKKTIRRPAMMSQETLPKQHTSSMSSVNISSSAMSADGISCAPSRNASGLLSSNETSTSSDQMLDPSSLSFSPFLSTLSSRDLDPFHELVFPMDPVYHGDLKNKEDNRFDHDSVSHPVSHPVSSPEKPSVSITFQLSNESASSLDVRDIESHHGVGLVFSPPHHMQPGAVTVSATTHEDAVTAWTALTERIRKNQSDKQNAMMNGEVAQTWSLTVPCHYQPYVEREMAAWLLPYSDAANVTFFPVVTDKGHVRDAENESEMSAVVKIVAPKNIIDALSEKTTHFCQKLKEELRYGFIEIAPQWHSLLSAEIGPGGSNDLFQAMNCVPVFPAFDRGSHQVGVYGSLRNISVAINHILGLSRKYSSKVVNILDTLPLIYIVAKESARIRAIESETGTRISPKASSSSSSSPTSTSEPGGKGPEMVVHITGLQTSVTEASEQLERLIEEMTGRLRFHCFTVPTPMQQKLMISSEVKSLLQKSKKEHNIDIIFPPVVPSQQHVEGDVAVDTNGNNEDDAKRDNVLLVCPLETSEKELVALEAQLLNLLRQVSDVYTLKLQIEPRFHRRLSHFKNIGSAAALHGNTHTGSNQNQNRSHVCPADWSVQVKFPDLKSNVKHITVKGPKNEVEKISDQMLRFVDKIRQQESYSDEIVLAKHQTAIFQDGKMGASLLRKIREDSHVDTIDIYPSSSGHGNVSNSNHTHHNNGHHSSEETFARGGMVTANHSWPTDRILIQGAPEHVNSAKNMILAKVDRLSDAITAEITIPGKYHRNLIGSTGRFVKVLMDKFDVIVHFPRATPTSSSANSGNGSGGSHNGGGNAGSSVLRMSLTDPPFSKTSTLSPAGSSARSPHQQEPQTASSAPVANNRVEGSFEEDPRVFFKGKLAVVEAARSAFLEMLEDEVKNSHQLTFQVRKEYLRHIVGTNGANISKIKESTGTRIDFLVGTMKKTTSPLVFTPTIPQLSHPELSEPIPNTQQSATANATGASYPLKLHDDMDLVVIEGPNSGCLAARERILTLVHELENTVTLEMRIDPKFHKQLIGHKGCRLLTLMDRYNHTVTIRFPRATAHDHYRGGGGGGGGGSGHGNGGNKSQAPDVVSIKGLKENVHKVKQDLEQMLRDLGETSVTIDYPRQSVSKLYRDCQDVKACCHVDIEIVPKSGDGESRHIPVSTSAAGKSNNSNSSNGSRGSEVDPGSLTLAALTAACGGSNELQNFKLVVLGKPVEVESAKQEILKRMPVHRKVAISPQLKSLFVNGKSTLLRRIRQELNVDVDFSPEAPVTAAHVVSAAAAGACFVYLSGASADVAKAETLMKQNAHVATGAVLSANANANATTANNTNANANPNATSTPTMVTASASASVAAAVSAALSVDDLQHRGLNSAGLPPLPVAPKTSPAFPIVKTTAGVVSGTVTAAHSHVVKVNAESVPDVLRNENTLSASGATEVIFVHPTYRGIIIGRHGVNISRLKVDHGAKVEVPRTHADVPFDRIAIRGPAGGVEIAKKTIASIMESLRHPQVHREIPVPIKVYQSMSTAKPAPPTSSVGSWPLLALPDLQKCVPCVAIHLPGLVWPTPASASVFASAPSSFSSLSSIKTSAGVSAGSSATATAASAAVTPTATRPVAPSYSAVAASRVPSLGGASKLASSAAATAVTAATVHAKTMSGNVSIVLDGLAQQVDIAELFIVEMMRRATPVSAAPEKKGPQGVSAAAATPYSGTAGTN